LRRGILEVVFRLQYEPEEAETFNFRNATRKKLPTSRRTPTAKAASPARASKKGPMYRGPHGPKPPLATTPRAAAAIPHRAHQSPILDILNTPYDLWNSRGLQSGNLPPRCALTFVSLCKTGLILLRCPQNTSVLRRIAGRPAFFFNNSVTTENESRT